MKHTTMVTSVLILFFLAAQLIGLGIIAAGTSVTVDDEGNRVVEHDDAAFVDRPQTQGVASFVYLLGGIAIGTLFLLVLIRFRQFMVWKFWFFVAVWMTITLALAVLINPWIAAFVGLLLAAWKIFRPNIYVHNLTEVLVYTGIAWMLIGIFDVFWACMLLIAISIYDAIAVWKSKHMIKLANFQTESKLFAGLLLPYNTKSGKVVAPKKAKKLEPPKPKEKSETNTAILGGGDIAFPLIFISTVFNWLIQGGRTAFDAYMISLIIVATTALALLYLFITAKKDHFYPAMPYLSVGCFIGLGIVLML